jgi:3-methyladenine DNA glycosylase/8-oxoguanine DNA glycosylase
MRFSATCRPDSSWCRQGNKMTASAPHLTNSDPVMAELVARLRSPDLKPRRLPPFQSLAHAIIHQQLGSAAAGTILDRVIFPCYDIFSIRNDPMRVCQPSGGVATVACAG